MAKKTNSNPLAEMMAETMAVGAISTLMGGNTAALAPMVAQLSKMDEKEMANMVNTLSPIVGVLSQLSK